MSENRARILVFCTSAAVLVLEILAGRLMAPYVGVSLETFTAIIGTILAGIAVGSAAGGRLADRYDPRILIGPALVIGGGLAWWSLAIVSWFGPLLGSASSAIVILAFLAFFAPAAVLSAVTPMATKLRLSSLDETGTVVGDLSAFGTAGALFGTFVTGFVLISALPTRPIVIGLGAALVIAGMVFVLRFTKGTPSAALALALVASAGIGITAGSPCEFESAYFCGKVVTDPDNPSLRFLHLDTLRHGAVDLADPTHLEFRYIQLIGSVIDSTSTGAIDALHVGGGGFSVPGWLKATRPGSYSLVLEIDQVLLDVARDELGLQTGPDLQVRIGDARLALGDLDDDSFDVIVGDAFASQAVPWHLTTTEFIGELDRVLRKDGIYVMNVLDGGDNSFAEWEAATLRAHFDYLQIIEPADGILTRVSNQIMVASDSPIPDLVFDPENGRLVPDPEAFARAGKVLRDDFAPVDQLLPG